MKLVMADKAMEVYYWEEDGGPNVTKGLTGQVPRGGVHNLKSG